MAVTKGEPLTLTERDLVRKAIEHYSNALTVFAYDVEDNGEDASNVHLQIRQLEVARRKIGPGPRT